MTRKLILLALTSAVMMVPLGGAAIADPADDAMEFGAVAAEIVTFNATAIQNETLGVTSGPDNIACTIGAWAGEVEPARTVGQQVTVHARDVLTADSGCISPDIVGGPPDYVGFLSLELLWYDRTEIPSLRWKRIKYHECTNSSIAGQVAIPLCSLEQAYPDPQDDRQYALRKGLFEAGYYSPTNGNRIVVSRREVGPLPAHTTAACVGCS
jgi:hypothetical protein